MQLRSSSNLRLFIQSSSRPGSPYFLVASAWLLLNLLVSVGVSLWIIKQAQPMQDADWLGASLAFASVFAVAFMYLLVSLILLKPHIKSNVLVGLLLLQQSRYLDGLEQVLLLNGDGLGLAEDLLFLLGAIVLAIGVTLWVMLTYRQATLDKLTRVHNRRHFEKALQQHLQSKRQEALDSCLLVLDLDNFKRINDGFGHSMGDIVLRRLGDVLRQCARREDVICRSGGEEFEILLVRASAEAGTKVAQRIMQQIAAATPDGLPTLTASMGITMVLPDDDVDSLRRRADKAMYMAKGQGKAQVVEL